MDRSAPCVACGGTWRCLAGAWHDRPPLVRGGGVPCDVRSQHREMRGSVLDRGRRLRSDPLVRGRAGGWVKFIALARDIAGPADIPTRRSAGGCTRRCAPSLWPWGRSAWAELPLTPRTTPGYSRRSMLEARERDVGADDPLLDRARHVDARHREVRRSAHGAGVTGWPCVAASRNAASRRARSRSCRSGPVRRSTEVRALIRSRR